MTDLDPSWQPRSSVPELHKDEVHVWRALLEPELSCVDFARKLLSEDEITRADRFIRELHRQRFALARGLLRWLLGAYLETAPEAIEFRYTEQGKPFLRDTPDDTGFQFNVSHSGDLALFAFTRDRALGVDVEQMRPRTEGDKIARRFFCEAEVEDLFALPVSQQDQGFYNCWTRKEAYIKARGQGMAIPLSSFRVSLAPESPAELLWCREGDEETKRWSVENVPPAKEYAGALVVRGQELHIQKFEAQLDRWLRLQGLTASPSRTQKKL